MQHRPIHSVDVQDVLNSYSSPVRASLMALRQLILDVAAETQGVGEIEETLKWGQISYLTHRPKSGTTIRIDEYGEDSGQLALFVHCQTTLIETFRQLCPDHFSYDGTRAIIFDRDTLGQDNEHLSEMIERMKHFIELALTYHQHKQVA